jgi:hypothetical protein|tara:strand:+ start:392 stop:706 length:315 start_codon:yes stop_codon:yes gene_type:complete
MDLKNLLREFINGGWIIPIIGAFGMIARMLNSKVDYCWKQYMRNILSAAILSGILWFILQNAPINDFIKAISYGVVGVISPEIINGVISLAKKYAKNPDKIFKK